MNEKYDKLKCNCGSKHFTMNYNKAIVEEDFSIDEFDETKDNKHLFIEQEIKDYEDRTLECRLCGSSLDDLISLYDDFVQEYSKIIKFV